VHKLVISENWAAKTDSPLVAGSMADRLELVNGLRSLSKEPVKIYRMSCEYGGEFYEIVTTSKEVFLTIGTFPTPLQGSFCRLIDEECRRAQQSVLLVLIADEDGSERKSGLLVSRTVVGDDVQFHLAKAQ
jgi:hypothetical protein